MIKIKKKEEIEKMRRAGKALVNVFGQVMKKVDCGVSKEEIEDYAWTLISKYGGKPSFAMVPGYEFATCLCVNEEVVHGVPDGYRLKKGDVFSMDMGIYLGGYHSDKSDTVVVCEKERGGIKRFLDKGREALEAAINVAREGNRVGDISEAIEKVIVDEGGYEVVRSLVGHGIGRNLHEDPAIPGFLSEDKRETAELKAGMTLAIEVIYSKGSSKVKHENNDGWTLITKDKSLSGLFEDTILVTKEKAEVLTRLN